MISPVLHPLETHGKVRAVIHAPHGCSERSEWHPEGSPGALAAMEALVKKQTGIYSVGWEYWDEENDPPDSSKAP